MEGKPPGEGFGPGSPGYGPGAEPPDEEDKGPQSPAPGSEGPQSPAPDPAPPPGGYAPPQPPGGGYAPPAPEAPPGAAPRYGGPVPPGGWQQPTAPPGGYQPQGQLAGWGSRAGAYLIDALVLFIPGIILFFVIVGSAVGVSGDDEDLALGAAIGLSILWLLIWGVIALLYAPVLMMRQGARNGQTWGKQATNIRAVRDDGKPFTFGSAALRDVLLKNVAVGIASSIIPLIPWFLNFFWPLWDDENRALHDMAASTHVIRA